jgi:CspA family cold shock protein
MSSDRSTGSVKWFNNKAGYGFVTVKGGDHDGKDVFAHYSAIKVIDDQFRYLVQGEYIEFDLTKDESGKHDFVVSNISGIKGGSLMCEVQRNNEASKKPTARVVYKYVVKEGNDTDGFQRVQKRGRKPNENKSYVKATSA